MSKRLSRKQLREGYPADRVIGSVLSDTRHNLTPLLEEWIGRLDGELRHMCGYQLGMYSLAGTPTGRVGGKFLRPALALLAAEAAGADVAAAWPAAAAVELLHNASLIHDDIMDGDELRRHRPTVWAHFGVPMAILAGDVLIGLGFEVLAAHDHPATRPALAELAATLRLLGQGQQTDIRLSQADGATIEDALGAATGKTAAFFGCVCRLGALYARSDQETTDSLHRFGIHLGVAFQLVDDLLGIWGDPAVTGKPAGSDLRSRKKSAPVVAALAADGACAARLRELYHAEKTDDEDIALMADLIDQAGGAAWVEGELDRQLSNAWNALAHLDVKPGAMAKLADLCDLITYSSVSMNTHGPRRRFHGEPGNTAPRRIRRAGAVSQEDS